MGDIPAEAALVEQAHRRDAQAFAEHLAGGNVKRPRYAAADVRPMPVRLAEGDDLAVGEDRPDQAYIGEMRAASIWIVDGEDVTFVDVTVEVTDDILAGEVQRADMDGDILIALRGAFALGIVQ